MRAIGFKLFIKRVKKLSVYKSDFLIGVIASVLQCAIIFCFITSYYRLVPDIAGWNQSQVICMYFAVSFMQSLFQCVYMGMLSFSQNYIKMGELDIVLTKPVNELRYITLFDMNIGELPVTILNFVILILSLKDLNMPVLQTMLFILAPFFGVRILYSISLMINCLSFKYVDTLMGIKFLLSSTDCYRYPISIYPQAVSFVLKFILPLSLVVFFPLLPKINYVLICGLLIFISMVLHIVAHNMWKCQLRNYCSTGS